MSLFVCLFVFSGEYGVVHLGTGAMKEMEGGMGRMNDEAAEG